MCSGNPIVASESIVWLPCPKHSALLAIISSSLPTGMIFVFTMFVDIMSCFQTFSVFHFLLFSQLAFNPFRRFFVDLWSSHFIFYALLWLFMIFFESHWFPFICNDFCEFLWIYSIFFVDLLSSSLILFEVLWFSLIFFDFRWFLIFFFIFF